jgi:DNA-binding transcriptional MerR regulator
MNYAEHYIKENLKRGISMDAIRRSLFLAGYTNSQIDESIRMLYKEHVRDLAKYVDAELKYGLSAETIRNYLIAIGHPKEHVDAAIRKIIRVKRYVLKKKKKEKTEEQFRQIYGNIKRNLTKAWLKLKYSYAGVETWKKFAYPPAAVVLIILFIWEISMIVGGVMLTGNVDCYSFGTLVRCSFLESVVFYMMIMVALTLILCLPVFLIGALIGWLVERNKKQ